MSLLLFGLVMTGFFFVLQYSENRNGFVIEKGWLDGIISPQDFSPYIFSITYAAALLGLIFCLRNPTTTLLLIRTYLLLQLLRMICLLIFPLNPPSNIIPLQDPFLHATFYNGRPNLKDLFFSGHVATIILFIPILSSKWIRGLLVAAAFIAGILLAAQRVHYVIDIISAPLFSLLAFYFADKWTKNNHGKSQKDSNY